PNNLRQYSYDNAGRLTSVAEPDRQVWSFTNFDSRNQPQLITMPGAGNITARYDMLGRLTTHTVSFNSFADVENFSYDGLHRMRHADSPAASVDLTYTPRGFMTETMLTIGSRQYPVAVVPRKDDTPDTTTYPSGEFIADTRDAFGQLRAMYDHTQ